MRPPASEVLKKTQRLWSERAGQPVSEEAARQMVANISGFFALLAEWAKHVPENDQAISAHASANGEAGLPSTDPGRTPHER